MMGFLTLFVLSWNSPKRSNKRNGFLLCGLFIMNSSAPNLTASKGRSKQTACLRYTVFIYRLAQACCSWLDNGVGLVSRLGIKLQRSLN